MPEDYGLYDTQDHCWLGTNDAGDGPKTFDDQDMARTAARVVERQLGWAAGRVRARRYHGDANLKKDEVQVKRSAIDSLRDIEEGRCL